MSYIRSAPLPGSRERVDGWFTGPVRMGTEELELLEAQRRSGPSLPADAGSFVRTPATHPRRVGDVSCCGVELAGRRPG